MYVSAIAFIVLGAVLGVFILFYLTFTLCNWYRRNGKANTKIAEQSAQCQDIPKEAMVSSTTMSSVYVPMRSEREKTSPTDLMMTTRQFSAPISTFMRPAPVQPRIYPREPPFGSWGSSVYRTPPTSTPLWTASTSLREKQSFIASQPVSRGSIETAPSSLQLLDTTESEHGSDFLSKGENKNLGELHFSVTYNISRRTLFVTILEAHNVPVMDASDLTNAYVRILLEPSSPEKEGSSCSLSHDHLDSPHLVTRVARRSVHPQWNEIFTLNNISPQDLLCHVLLLKVQDSQLHHEEATHSAVQIIHSLEEDPLIGMVKLSLKPLYEPKVPEKSFNLGRYLQPEERCRRGGELLIGLSYKHRSSTLTVKLMEARHLHAKEEFLVENIYAAVLLTNSAGKVLYKSSNLRPTGFLEPVWGTKLKLKHLSRKELVQDCFLIVRLFVVTKEHQTFPGLALGEVSIATQRNLQWSRVMSCDRQSVQCWHPVRPTLREYTHDS